MSSSTISFEKEQFSNPESRNYGPKFTELRQPNILIFSLWLLHSLYSACKIELATNLLGITTTFNNQDLLLILLSAWLMYKGICRRNMAFIVPWVLIHLHGIYFTQCNLKNIIPVMRSQRFVSAFQWAALIAAIFSLLLRLTLTCITVHLSAQLWYTKKLEKELHDTLN